jgi:hypothetical protein
MPNSHVTQGKPVLVPVGAPLIEEAIFAANLLTLRPIEVRGSHSLEFCFYCLVPLLCDSKSPNLGSILWRELLQYLLEQINPLPYTTYILCH